MFHVNYESIEQFSSYFNINGRVLGGFFSETPKHEGDSEPLTVQENGNPSSQRSASTKPYTAIDLIKSKRLFLTSIILWFAW